MSKETNTKRADNWMARFGKLEDVTERTGAKGSFITFKLQAKGFVQYGACFDEKVMEEMKQAVGKDVWLKGPIDTHAGRDADGNPREMKSFKVIYFKISEPKSQGDRQEMEEAA